MSTILLLALIAASLHLPSLAQTRGNPLWSDISEALFAKEGGKKDYVQQYRTLVLDTTALSQLLSQAQSEEAVSLREATSEISLPLPDGTFARFRFVESATMAPGADPDSLPISTYMGQGIDDIYASVAFDLTTEGFHAMMTTGDEVVYIEPYQREDMVHYICFYKRDLRWDRTGPFEQQGPVKPGN